MPNHHFSLGTGLPNDNSAPHDTALDCLIDKAIAEWDRIGQGSFMVFVYSYVVKALAYYSNLMSSTDHPPTSFPFITITTNNTTIYPTIQCSRNNEN